MQLKHNKLPNGYYKIALILSGIANRSYIYPAFYAHHKSHFGSYPR